MLAIWQVVLNKYIHFEDIMCTLFMDILQTFCGMVFVHFLRTFCCDFVFWHFAFWFASLAPLQRKYQHFAAISYGTPCIFYEHYIHFWLTLCAPCLCTFHWHFMQIFPITFCEDLIDILCFLCHRTVVFNAFLQGIFWDFNTHLHPR